MYILVIMLALHNCKNFINSAVSCWAQAKFKMDYCLEAQSWGWGTFTWKTTHTWSDIGLSRYCRVRKGKWKGAHLWIHLFTPQTGSSRGNGAAGTPQSKSGCAKWQVRCIAPSVWPTSLQKVSFYSTKVQDSSLALPESAQAGELPGYWPRVNRQAEIRGHHTDLFFFFLHEELWH